MRVTGPALKYIVISFCFFIVISLIVTSVKGKSQDKVFAKELAEYSLMVSTFEQGDYKSALEISSSLEERQNNSDIYNYITALSAVNAGEFVKGIRHFQRTLDINPHMVEDSMFMLQFAEVLIVTGMMEEASIVLERCSSLLVPENYPQYQERIAQLQEQLAEQS